MKACKTCNKLLEFTSENFYRDQRSPDGLRSSCKVCEKKKKKAYRDRVREERNLPKESSHLLKQLDELRFTDILRLTKEDILNKQSQILDTINKAFTYYDGFTAILKMMDSLDIQNEDPESIIDLKKKYREYAKNKLDQPFRYKQ